MNWAKACCTVVVSLRTTLVLHSTQGKCFSCQRGKRDAPRHSAHYGATRFLANIYHPDKFKFEMKQLMPCKHSLFDLLTPLPPIPCTGWTTKWVGHTFLALLQLKGKRSPASKPVPIAASCCHTRLIATVGWPQHRYRK